MKDTGFKGAAPTDQWLTIPAIYEKVAAAGYTAITEIEREDNSYDVEATSPGGERVDLPCRSGDGRGDQLAHRRPEDRPLPYRAWRLLHRPMPVVFGNENDSSNGEDAQQDGPWGREAQLKLDADNGDLLAAGFGDHGDRN